MLCLKSDFVSVRHCDLEMDEVEAVVCEISDINNSKMIIAVFYRPPNMDFGYLQNVVNIFYNVHRNGINNNFILGDFNFSNVNWSNYTSSSNFDSIFIECLYDCFWSQLINVPTRCANDRTTMLDLLITSVPEYVRCIESLSGEFSSDHMIITFEIIVPPKHIKPFKRYFYNYKDADFAELRNLLKIVPWDLAYEEDDMELSTTKWKDLFHTAADDCVPKIKVRSANSAPWIDTEVLKAVRKKERLGKKAKKSSSVYHWATFQRCQAELKSLVKWKPKQYFKGLSSTLTENPKQFWAYYQSKYKNKRLPSSVRFNGANVSDTQDKAELFNNYFNSVFKSDDCVPLHEDCFLGDFDVGADVLNNIKLFLAIVLKFLEQLNICKSYGPDNVTSQLLKECANSISSPLCTLFNKQLSSGCFPKMWKVAYLVPVFKSGDKEMVENYRGISLLCIISKVLEKCTFSCVFPFFQPKLVKGCSCVTSLLRSTFAFAKALDEKKQLDTVFLDYS